MATASPSVLILSTRSSGIVIPNSTSNSLTNSTRSRESGPKSSANEVERLTCSSLTPSLSNIAPGLSRIRRNRRPHRGHRATPAGLCASSSVDRREAFQRSAPPHGFPGCNEVADHVAHRSRGGLAPSSANGWSRARQVRSTLNQCTRRGRASSRSCRANSGTPRKNKRTGAELPVYRPRGVSGATIGLATGSKKV